MSKLPGIATPTASDTYKFIVLGTDAATHIAEEIEGADVVVPQCMVWSFFANMPLTVITLFTFGSSPEILLSVTADALHSLQLRRSERTRWAGAATICACLPERSRREECDQCLHRSYHYSHVHGRNQHHGGDFEASLRFWVSHHSAILYSSY